MSCHQPRVSEASEPGARPAFAPKAPRRRAPGLRPSTGEQGAVSEIGGRADASRGGRGAKPSRN
jgi:hypothetical protein